jgi:glycosyltransferase involved in cell wall biosynthesis
MKITVITVCFNAQKTIVDTILSVAEQGFPDVEYIIVDGGSTDATMELVKSNSARVARCISERDNGLYDAMNKGIQLATGDVIGFLHADDLYADEQVLSRVAAMFNDMTVDACYGDLVYIAADNAQRTVRTWRAGDFDCKKMYNGWMPPHPTFFVRRHCYLQNGGYRTDMGSSADYELMLRYILCCKIKMVYVPHTLVCMRSGGISNATFRNRISAHAMDWKAWRVNGLLPYPWSLPFKPLRKLLQWL